MDNKERYAPTTPIPLDLALVEILRRELVLAAGTTGDFEQTRQAVHDLDLMGEATKPDVLYGLHRLGQNKSWVQDLHDAIAAAKVANHPERVQELVRMAHLMEQTEDSFGLRTVLRIFDRRIPSANAHFQNLWDQAEADKAENFRRAREAARRAREEAERQARGETERVRREAEEAGRQRPWQIEDENGVLITEFMTQEVIKNSEEEKRGKELEEEMVEAEITRFMTEQIIKENEKKAREKREEEIEAEITEIQGQLQKEELERKRRVIREETSKSEEWITAQSHFQAMWDTLIEERGLPGDQSRDSRIERLIAIMDILHEYILSPEKNSSTILRAGIEVLAPQIAGSARALNSFFNGAFPEGSESHINEYSQIIYLPAALRFTIHDASELIPEEKKQVQRIHRNLLSSVQPDANGDPVNEGTRRFPNSNPKLQETIKVLEKNFNAGYKCFQ